MQKVYNLGANICVCKHLCTPKPLILLMVLHLAVMQSCIPQLSKLGIQIRTDEQETYLR